MRVLDDCHSYILSTFMDSERDLTFYEMREDGKKFDGVTNEEVLKVLIHRIRYLNETWQDGKFKCRENSIAITKLEEALMWLERRTTNRIERGVEGTHKE